MDDRISWHDQARNRFAGRLALGKGMRSASNMKVIQLWPSNNIKFASAGERFGTSDCYCRRIQGQFRLCFEPRTEMDILGRMRESGLGIE